VSAIPRKTTRPKRPAPAPGALLALIVKVLDDGKAEDLIVIDLEGKSSMADHMVIATGRSQRQVAALAEHVMEALKAGGYGRASAEGLTQGDWVLIDGGDVLVHLFRPDIRSYYNLEKMWGATFGEGAEAAL
jgi:ribosome-associated protein